MTTYRSIRCICTLSIRYDKVPDGLDTWTNSTANERNSFAKFEKKKKKRKKEKKISTLGVS